MGDDVPYTPVLAQRRRLPLFGRQRRQKIGQVCPLGGGHLEPVHGITSSSLCSPESSLPLAQVSCPKATALRASVDQARRSHTPRSTTGVRGHTHAERASYGRPQEC